MKHDLTVMGYQLLAILRDRKDKAPGCRQPEQIAKDISAPERDIRQSLEFFVDLSYVSQKTDTAYLDPIIYNLTDLGLLSLHLYEEKRKADGLPRILVPPLLA